MFELNIDPERVELKELSDNLGVPTRFVLARSNSRLPLAERVISYQFSSTRNVSSESLPLNQTFILMGRFASGYFFSSMRGR